MSFQTTYENVTILITGLWLAGKAGMEKKMEITIMGYMGTTIVLPRQAARLKSTNLSAYICRPCRWWQ